MRRHKHVNQLLSGWRELGPCIIRRDNVNEVNLFAACLCFLHCFIVKTMNETLWLIGLFIDTPIFEGKGLN